MNLSLLTIVTTTIYLLGFTMAVALNCGSSDNNLAGPNPVPRAHAPTPSWTTKLLAIGTGNVIFLILTLLCIIVSVLNLWQEENSRGKNISIVSPLKGEGMCRCFPLAEIQSATNNFNEDFVIGKGGFSKVYRGLIDEETKTVAIKRLNSKSEQGDAAFWMEVESISKLRHINLVSLIGYCDDSQEMLLVYEYMAHGNLAGHIHKTGRNCMNLSWEQRLNICIGAARGLAYLHTSRGPRHEIIHRDVKSTNILLDEKWVAKISDFGLAKMDPTNLSHTHFSTNVKGTFGYLDPEYFQSGRLTTKSDVYAFGVVLFEVLCGRPAVDLGLVEEEEHSLARWAQQCIREGILLDEMVDPSMRGKISPHCLEVFAGIANKCLNNHPNERPTMAEAVVTLEFALEKQGWADSSTDASAGMITPLSDYVHPTSSTSGKTKTKTNVVWWDSLWHRVRLLPSKANSLPLLPQQRFQV